MFSRQFRRPPRADDQQHALVPQELPFAVDSQYEKGVSYKGTVKNGVVVLPPEAQLPEGAEVEVTPLEARADDPPFLQAILKLAKPRDWPEDFALNHAHYAKGKLFA
jgi:hypothetical protein